MKIQKKPRCLLSIFLVFTMLLGVFPMTALSVHASNGYSDADHMNDRTDINMNFNYPYSEPTQVLLKQKNSTNTPINAKDAGDIYWKHIRSFGCTKGDLNDLLQSTKTEDKYLVLDKDLYEVSSHGDFETIVIKSDKILDLNGHQIKLRDQRNKVDNTSWIISDTFYQSSDAKDFQTVMFSIQNGATLTIIDSSASQKGEIFIDAYMIDPFAHNIKRYTTRDIFSVDDGNLVIYGGKYRAGRSKAQAENKTFDKIKTVVGDVVSLATDVAGYATGINSATGAYQDAVFNAKQALDAIQKEGNRGTEPTDQTAAITNKKDGSDSKQEKKQDNPTDKASGENGGRNQTVGEKQQDKDKSKDNKSNAKGSAQYDGNSKIAAAENAVANAATNKSAIGKMVDSAFNLASSIKKCFEVDEHSIVTQSFLGTVVNVGNGGTFVSYGGTYIGYGMTPNIRNGVVECTTQGKAYIYGGLFEGRCGANIFNIVKYNNQKQKVTQYIQDGKTGTVKETTTMMNPDETNGWEILSMVNKVDSKGNIVYDKDGNPEKVPVNTDNIRVRGGTFRCYYEATMVGLHEDKVQGSGDHNGDNMTMFIGSSGGVNLGVESYNEDFIRDGRIQILDNYGDGALVLMDDNKESGNKSIFHYRLFCTDEELRKNRYLTVYPNTADSNSTFSFSLQTRYGSQDASNFTDVSQFWSDSEENDRGVFSSDEKFFTYPINDKSLSEKYYVIPYLTNTDVYGQNLDTSEVWYYNKPTDTRGRNIESFDYGYSYMLGTVNDNGQVYSGIYRQNSITESTWKNGEKSFVRGTVSYSQFKKNYRNNVKWIKYKVYRVDPLTLENLSTTFGEDQPVKEVCYGASDEALKCRLPLSKLGIDYKAGEMYRVVMSVDEYLTYDGIDNELNTASCTSSIVFMCYDTHEYKVEGNKKVEDFTPVQWINEPQAGKTATVQIVNGQAGKVDFQYRKLFDIYYQWYEVNPNGEDKLIAGTTNIYKDKKDVYTADLVGLKSHNFSQMLPNIDGYKYVNTVNPSDPNKATYGSNGLPKNTTDWTVDMLHAYLESETPESRLTKNANYSLTPQNNNVMATGTDSCYIPESCEGKTIYCKVTAVNHFWLRNFDHVQVFYSHKIDIPEVVKPLNATLSVSKNDNHYVTADKNVTLSVSDVKGLSKNEKITKVEYIALAGSSKKVRLDNLSTTNVSEIKSVSYPKDFYSGVVHPWSNVKLYAKLYTSEGRTAQTNVELVNYEVEATDLSFDYHNYYFYEGIYHNVGTFSKEVSIVTTPKFASIGYSFVNGESFTSSDPQVATFDSKGKLVAGTKEGRTTLTLKTPNGTTKKLIFANPIQRLEASDIDAPVVGQKFDLTGKVPSGANYKIKEIYWTEGKNGTKLSATAVAEKYRSYTAHVVFQENSGHEFMTDDTAFGDDEYFVDIPYTMTVNLADGTKDTVSGSLYGVDSYSQKQGAWKANQQNTIEAIYSFSANVADGSDVIDTVIIDYPTEVNEGDSIEDWKKQVKVVTAAGDAVDVTVDVGVSARHDDIWKANGFGNNESPKIFAKDAQSGIQIILRIPEELSVKFKEKSSDITFIVNGKADTDLEISNSATWMMVSKYNTLTVKDTDNAHITPRPMYNIANAVMTVGEAINVNDLLITDENGLEFRLGNEDISTDYYDYYAEENTLVAKKVNNDKSENVDGLLVADFSGNGIKSSIRVDFRLNIYETEADKPTVGNSTITVNAYRPSGSKAYTVKRYVPRDVTDDNYYIFPKYFSIPEISGAFISSIESTERPIEYGYGFNRLYTLNSHNNKTITVKTVSVNKIHISAGTDKVYVSFDDNIEGINISLDNRHFYAGGYLTGLKPNTEYTLYYRQGIDGTVYSKQFKTATVDYGVTVGSTAVTNLNKGNLEKDGWTYDPSKKKLTLKNLNLNTVGTNVKDEALFGHTGSMYGAAIVAHSDLTVELIGENTIQKQSSNNMFDNVIHSLGTLTLTGNGNLKVIGTDSIWSQGIYTEKGNIYLKSAGKVTFEDVGNALYLSNEKDYAVYYYNGEYIYTPINYTHYDGSIAYNGALCDEKVTLDISNASHTLKVYSGKSSHDETLVSNENAVTTLKTNTLFTHLIPNHSCIKQVKSAEYLVSGNCTDGATYYKSCECGYTDKKSTFTVAQHEHSYTSYSKKSATCTEDGWNAYKVCADCGDTNFKAISAKGHTIIHHNAKAATCTQIGWNAYDECSVCGMTTYAEIPAIGHTLVHHAAQPATCTAEGWNEHDTCKNCDYSTRVSVPKIAHTLVHHAGKEATITENGWKAYDECTKCDYSTYKIIPIKAPLANTSTLSATTITKGQTVTVNGSATGGVGSYKYAVYSKKSADSTWTTVQSYKTTSKVSVTLAEVGTYNLCVKVQDTSGTIAKKYFNVTVKTANLQNISTLSATTITKGQSVTVKGAATGGTIPYQYAYFYKKASDTSWVKVKGYSTATSVKITPASATVYDVCIYVKDASNQLVKKYLKVTVN